ncbi:MAG: hypothetical protein WD844_14565 [Thermoleophilaceae bacterium]
MTRRLAGLVVLLALLAPAAAAHAADFTVNHGGNDGDDTPGDTQCETNVAGQCTLRAALEEANALAGTDAISFAGAITDIDVPSTLDASDQVSITGPVTLDWTGAAGPLLRFVVGAADSTIEDVDVLGGTTAGIDVATSGVTVRRTRVSGSGGHGIDLNGNAVTVTASPIFGNAGQPIADSPVAAPASLRVGPRQADGTLPVTGATTAGGVLELFRGNPAATSPIALIAGPLVPAGGFSHVLATEPQPASALSATITSAGTSGFAATTVPFDVVSPQLVGAVAISLNEVTVQLSEPVWADSVQAGDFALEMAGVARPIDGIRIEPGGAQVTLISSMPWGHGEAGRLSLGPPGSLLDAGGNASLAAATVGVAAAPGDLISPVGSSLSIRPSSLCVTRSRTCRRTGTTVRFVAGEGGRAHLVLMRGNRRIGEDEALSDVGRNRIRFNGRLGNRKLRAGNYRMLLYLEDAVGNLTLEPPLQLFTIRRTR